MDGCYSLAPYGYAQFLRGILLSTLSRVLAARLNGMFDIGYDGGEKETRVEMDLAYRRPIEERTTGSFEAL